MTQPVPIQRIVSNPAAIIVVELERGTIREAELTTSLPLAVLMQCSTAIVVASATNVASTAVLPKVLEAVATPHDSTPYP